MKRRKPALAASATALSLASASVHAETVNTRLGPLTLDHSLPTADTRQKLYDELDFQRAVQGVIWAEPAINNELFRRAMEKVGVPKRRSTGPRSNPTSAR